VSLLRKVERNDACPCGSGLKFKKCCGLALDGSLWPQTPEALMRSRYSAYVTGNAEHLFRTTHPENEAVAGVTRERFKDETIRYCQHVDFEQLEVLGTEPTDEQGSAAVTFTAHYKLGANRDSFTERSEFVQVDGRWLYFRGAAPDGSEL
jgi:SEC-C motif domain protein